jgi:hypothetical protein
MVTLFSNVFAAINVSVADPNPDPSDPYVFGTPVSSVVDPDPESDPDPVGSGTFCRIRSRIRNK